MTRSLRFAFVGLVVSAAGCEIISGLDDANVVNTGASSSGQGAGGSASTNVGGGGGGQGGHAGGAGGSGGSGGGGGTCDPGMCHSTSGCAPSDSSSDDRNCGGCGLACAAPGACVGGHCRVLAKAAGPAASVCARVDGTHVRCWGADQYCTARDAACGPGEAGQFGPGNAFVARTTAMSGSNGCLIAGGAVSCWGAVSTGVLGGTPDATDPCDDSLGCATEPQAITDISSAIEVVVGGGDDPTLTSTACARELAAPGTNHTIRCWGYDDTGQFGDGMSGASANSLVPQLLPPASLPIDPVELAAGYQFNCARGAVKDVYCWGDNTHKKLGGAPLMGFSTTPVRVALPLGSALSISTGAETACAVLSNHDVHCWGFGGYGQLGNGSFETPNSPVKVSGLAALQVSVGQTHTCAIDTDKRVRCWGDNRYGSLGLAPPPALEICQDGSGSQTCSASPSTPLLPQLSADALELFSGNGFSCARFSDDKIRCWGRDDHGQLGRDTSGPNCVTGTVSYCSTPVAVKFN